MKRPTAQRIFRSVVFAGAMLGGGACGKKPAPAAPTAPATNQEPTSTEATTEDGETKSDPDATPRPRADATDCNDRSKPGCFSGGLGFIV